MILENYGVQADLVEVDARGCLHINLTTDRDLRVTINGKPINSDANPVQATRFWSSDGTQTDQRPLDLRGEER